MPCMPYYMHTIYLKAFEAYGKQNYSYTKAIVKGILASLKGAKDLRFWQSLVQKVSMFPYCSFNLSRQTASLPYLNEKNLTQLWCLITPLGDFNPNLDRHLML